MSNPVLTDKSQPPTEKSVLAAIGRAGPAWRELFARVRAEYPDLSESWRYYTDGKSWLLKVTRKSTTVFWLSVQQGAFRVGFYFPERLTDAVLKSDISETLKARIKKSAPTGKLRSATVEFGSKRGVRDVLTLIELKKTLK